MAGLGLTNALMGYQQGVQFKEQQDAKQRLEKANEAYRSIITADQQEWMKNEKAQGVYQPSDSTYLKAIQARQAALAQQGDFDNYMRGAATMAPLVAGMRKKALESSTDEAELAKAIYPTFMDGRDLKSADWVDGTGPDGKKSARQLRLTLDDGSVKMLPEGRIQEMVRKSVQSPGEALAEAQYTYGLKRDAAGHTARLDEIAEEGKKRIAADDNRHRNTLAEISARGDQARQTKQVAPGKAPGLGGAGGGNSGQSLDLREVQQIRMRLDARRKEALSLLTQQQKAAANLFGDEKKAALSQAQANYDTAMRSLNQQDEQLMRRLNAHGGGGGKGNGLEAFDRSAPQEKRPGLSSFYKN